MALSILDGNQSATTLSTILSSGQHITAHTVVSLGTQAITDMRSAVSGSVVSISNFPASQSTTFGAVTGSVSVLNFPASQSVTFGATTGSVSILNFPSSQTVTFADASLTNTQLRASAVTVGGAVTASISGSVTLGTGTSQIGSVTASISGTVPISISSVTIGNSVTIASLPAISGTVTASFVIPSTSITSGSFTSLASATLVPANTARKMATIYNLGAGQLFVNAGATATTLGGGFMVALSSGDYFECNFTTTTLSAIFATAGTASWVSY